MTLPWLGINLIRFNSKGRAIDGFKHILKVFVVS